jgi:hypothetical protein
MTYRRVALFGIAASAWIVSACGSSQSIEPLAGVAPDSPTTTTSTQPPAPDTVVPSTLHEVAELSSTAAVTSTTRWAPPTITWPTTPFTLPPDYGSGSTCHNIAAAPRVTAPHDSVLPPIAWTVNDDIQLRFNPPDDFRQDPMPPPPVGDCDRSNGLYLLERWAVVDDPAIAQIAGLSVQANPGDQSPLLSRQEFSDSIVTDDLTWYLYNGATAIQDDQPPNMGLAVHGDYLFMMSGPPTAMRSIAERLQIDP